MLLAGCGLSKDDQAEQAAAEQAAAKEAAAKKAAREAAAKEAAAKEAAAKEKTEVIAAVLSFLNEANLAFTSYYSSSTMVGDDVYIYQDFEYFESDESLRFAEIIKSAYEGRGVNYFKSTYTINLYHIDLKEVGSTLSVTDAGDLKNLIIPAQRVRTKSIELESKSRYSAAKPTSTDIGKLDSKPWGSWKPKKIGLHCDANFAPRLKAALEDLLRVHGVSVHKY